MFGAVHAAWKQVVRRLAIARIKPIGNRLAGRFGQFKLYRTTRLLLGNVRPFFYLASGLNITDSQPYEVASSQFAVNRQIEKR